MINTKMKTFEDIFTIEYTQSYLLNTTFSNSLPFLMLIRTIHSECEIINRKGNSLSYSLDK
jgi:hypothetical protein